MKYLGSPERPEEHPPWSSTLHKFGHQYQSPPLRLSVRVRSRAAWISSLLPVGCCRLTSALWCSPPSCRLRPSPCTSAAQWKWWGELLFFPARISDIVIDFGLAGAHSLSCLISCFVTRADVIFSHGYANWFLSIFLPLKNALTLCTVPQHSFNGYCKIFLMEHIQCH